MKREFCKHFQELFITSSPSSTQIDAALEGVQPRATDKMKEELD